MENIDLYRRKFQIPADFNIVISKTGGNRMVFAMDKSSAEIEIVADDEMPAMLAKIKMGLINPLLATYYFQKDLSEAESGFANAFVDIINPILDAWEMKTIKKYAPELLKQELEDIAELMKDIDKMKKTEAYKKKLDREKRIYLGLWAMAYALEMTDVIKINILYFFDDTAVWENYLKTIKELAAAEPDPYLLPKLPQAAGAHFTVKVKGKPYWHFEVRDRL